MTHPWTCTEPDQYGWCDVVDHNGEVVVVDVQRDTGTMIARHANGYAEMRAVMIECGALDGLTVPILRSAPAADKILARCAGMAREVLAKYPEE